MSTERIRKALRLHTHEDADADISPNSGAFWHPKLDDAGLPVPETRFCSLWMEEDEDEIGFNDPGVRWDEQAVHEAAEAVGGYPVFVRTAFTSGKHDFEDMCRIETRGDIQSTVGNLVHEPVRKFIPAGCLMIREWLDLDTRYTAFRAETPIAPEVRLFVEDGEVACWHDYWPDDAIKNADEDVKAVNEEIRAVIEAEQDEVLSLGRRAAEAIHGTHEAVPAWSVDVARTEGGEWYVIDAAHAGTSHHPGDCSNQYTDPR